MASDYKDRNDNSNINSTINSLTGGVVVVDLVGGVATPTSLDCKVCYLKSEVANSNVVYVDVVDANDTAAAASLSYPLISTATEQGLEIPIDNLSKLTFFSADATAQVKILWRS